MRLPRWGYVPLRSENVQEEIRCGARLELEGRWYLGHLDARRKNRIRPGARSLARMVVPVKVVARLRIGFLQRNRLHVRPMTRGPPPRVVAGLATGGLGTASANDRNAFGRLLDPLFV